VFDNLILNDIKSTRLPEIKVNSTRTLNHDDLVNIDVLARTMYGEMASCFKNGLQYPRAVARIILNRAEKTSRLKEFSDRPQNLSKPIIAQVASSPRKFNNWLIYNSGKKNGPLHQSLCPPKTINAPFWKDNEANSYDIKVWDDAVKIATDVILNTENFKKETSELENIFFYTSNMKSYGEKGIYKQVYPKIDNGRSVNNTKCIELWKENT